MVRLGNFTIKITVLVGLIRLTNFTIKKSQCSSQPSVSGKTPAASENTTPAKLHSIAQMDVRGLAAVSAAERLAVISPIEGECPAGQGFARIPLALAVSEQAVRSEFILQAMDKPICKHAFGWADGFCGPLACIAVR